MGTAVVCLVVCDVLMGIWMELDGELDVKLGRRCRGCERGSACDSPIKLSTGNPSWKGFRDIPVKYRSRLTRRRCCMSSSLYTSFSRDIRIKSCSVSTRRLRSASFSLLRASKIISEVGSTPFLFSKCASWGPVLVSWGDALPLPFT